jgi:hypothetical protein
MIEPFDQEPLALRFDERERAAGAVHFRKRVEALSRKGSLVGPL